MDIYAEEIISHYEHPHNKHKLDNPSITFHRDNPTCGDDLTMYLKIKDAKVEDASFTGSGCAISMASASMLTDEVKGKSLSDVQKMNLDTIIDLIGIDPGPARLKCATLSLRVLKEAVFIYEKKPIDSATKQL